MKLPITNYEVTSRDIIETIFGSLLVIFGLIGSIIIANIMIYPITKNSKNMHLNIFLLFTHIIIILVFIMIVQYVSIQFIQNQLILNSIFSFFGPIIVGSSLFFMYNVKEIVALSISILT